MAKLEVHDAKSFHDTESWLRRIPVPQPTGTRDANSLELSNETIYVHAIYWSIVTFSHIGIGDVTAITVPERLFNCLVTLIYTFAYAILFGNIASMVNDLTGAVTTKLHAQHTFVVQLLNKKKLKHFKNQVEEYFNYIWFVNKGIEEKDLLDDLPFGLHSDIRLSRYSYLVKSCVLFKNASGRVDVQLSRSLLRIMEI
jgi:hypothetical protein